MAPVENAYVAWLDCAVELVRGNAADDELEASVAAVDDVVPLPVTVVEEDMTELLGTSMLDVLFATAMDDAEEVAVLVSDWLVTMLLFEDKNVLDD